MVKHLSAFWGYTPRSVRLARSNSSFNRDVPYGPPVNSTLAVAFKVPVSVGCAVSAARLIAVYVLVGSAVQWHHQPQCVFYISTGSGCGKQTPVVVVSGGIQSAVHRNGIPAVVN